MPRLSTPVRPRLLRWVSLAAVVLAGSAAAQTHRCSSVYGPYASDRACAIAGGTRLGSIGPADSDEAPARPPPSSVERAPEYLGHMSADCAGLNDAIRTAAARGLSEATRHELRADYQRRCSADEALARQRWELEQQRTLQRREQQRVAVVRQVEREQAEQQRAVLQCSEMRRIVAGKQSRMATLSPGELGDLRRFEALVAERCGPVPR
ncbi:MAG: hypothetical protein U1F56_08830 [Rubrivivax sp.]